MIRTLLWGFGVLVLLIGAAVSLLLAACHDGEVRLTKAVRNLEHEFSIGKPSSEFIKRAMEIPADEYWVYPGEASLHTGNENVSSYSNCWHISIRDHKGTAYEEGLEALEARFRRLKDGRAQIQVTVSPPFLRDFCTVEFKDSKITKVELSQLD